MQNYTEFTGAGDNKVTSISQKDSSIYINKNQRFTSINPEIWEYWLGGHQIVQKWIKERKNEKLTEDEITHFIDIVGIIKDTISICSDIDAYVQLTMNINESLISQLPFRKSHRIGGTGRKTRQEIVFPEYTDRKICGVGKELE